MANLVDINQLYHFLSKSPVGLDTTLSKVRNKSGHTLTTDDIFGEEIPACFVPDDVKQLNNIPEGSLNKNDLAAIAYGSSNASYYYYDGSKWVTRGAWQDHELFFNKNSEYLNNGTDYNSAKKSDAVIEYHKERFGYFVTDNNNNGTGSNKMSVRVLKNNDADIISGNFVSQFLQSTDKFVSGIPSLGYNPLVYNTAKNTILLEDANDSGLYISNSYAGVIQFNSQGTEESGKGYVKDIKISVWEYIGDTLTDVLGGFASKDLGLKYGVVDSLVNVPDDKKEGWIYFVASSNPDEENVYDEFIWVDDKWEQIGSTAVNLPIVGENNIFDLNAFVVSHANVEWVQNMVKHESITYLPHINTFYPSATNQLEAKELWLEEAKTTGKVSVQLIFPYDSYQTNEVIRQMFWQLDQDNEFTYGSDESISKKYMRPGLTVKYFTFLDDGNWVDYNDYEYDTYVSSIDNDTSGKHMYPSYVFQTWIGKSKMNKSEIDWSTPNWSWYKSDSFMSPYNWTITPNEQQIKILKEAIIANKTEIEKSRLRITHNNWVENNKILNTTSTWGDTIETAQITRDYFTTGEVSAIEILYDSDWSNNTPIYLFVSVFDSNGNEITHFVSKNKVVKTANTTSYIFKFDNCVIPEDYSYVVLSASSQNTRTDDMDSQQFRVIALRNSNSKDDKISVPNCKFTSGDWTGAGRVPAIKFIRYISNEVQTDITEDVTEDSYSVSTTKAIKDYLKQIDGHEEWHTSNGLQHIELYNIENTNTYQDNTAHGVKCAGFIFNTPYMLKLSKLYIHGYYTNPNAAPPSGGNTDFDIYIKIIDPVSGHVLAVSDKGENIATSTPNPGPGQFTFSEENSTLLPKDTDFKIIFSSNNNKHDTTNDKTFLIALGNNNNIYPNTNLADKFPTHNRQGAFTNRYFTKPNANESDWIPAPSSYIINGLTRLSSGLSVIPYGKFNKTEEFNDVAYEALKIYQHTDEQNLDVTDHINNTDIHFSYKNIQDYSDSITTYDNCDPSKCLADTTKGKGDTVFAIEYSKDHFVPSALIKKITIPYDYDNQAGVSSNKCNLVLEVFKNSNDVTPSDVFFSYDKDSYTNTKNEYSFTFNNLILPDDYAFVRISITSQISTDADGNQTRTAYEKFRIIPLRLIGETDKGDESDIFEKNDECKVYWTYSNNTLSNEQNFIANLKAEYPTLILHKDNDVRHITQEERDRWNSNVTGINVGTDDNPINPEARIVGEGFLKGVTAINFRGAFVNVVKKDEKTIDVWINKDNNHPEASTASSEGVTTNSKYVFGSSTNAWQLPYNVNNGEKFTSCHPLTENQKITIKGTKEGITCNPVSVKNLTSKIRVEIYDNNERLIKKHETPDYITRDLPEKGASPSGSSISSSQGGITISITNLKRYCDVDESGLGWDASNGYIPDTVSFNCSITLDTSDILPNGGTYEARVYLDTYDADGNCESITLHDGEMYYAYDVKTANIDGVPSVKIQTVNGTELIKTRWVSGVEYIAKDTKFEVTHQPMENTTYMVADNATIRGSVTLSNCSCDDTNITGSTDDIETTIIPRGSKIFTLGSNNSVQESLAATQTAYSVGGNDIEKGKYLHTSMKIWSTGTDDTYNTAYFEKEQTENEGYGRILGHIDGNTLVINSDPFNPKLNYANQAKVYDGTLVYGSGTGNKYYVRKFKKNNDATTASLLKGFNITIPGLMMDGDKMEVWYFMIDDEKLGLSMGQKISASSPDGIGELDKNNSNKVYAAINVNALPVVPNDDEDFYIVIVLKDNTVSITGDIIIS